MSASSSVSNRLEWCGNRATVPLDKSVVRWPHDPVIETLNLPRTTIKSTGNKPVSSSHGHVTAVAGPLLRSERLPLLSERP
jgi:hypothetical protein